MSLYNAIYYYTIQYITYMIGNILQYRKIHYSKTQYITI